MRRAATLLMLAAGSLCGCSRAVDGYCDARLSAGQEQVTVGPFTYKVSQPMNSATLSAMREHSANETTMGLTVATAETSVDIHLRGISVPGGVCVRADATVDLSYKQPVDVFLARELRPGSCGYREVLAHEMRHVTTFRDHLRHAQDQMNEELHRILPAHRTYRFASMDEASRTFVPEIQSQLLERAESTMASVQAAQSRIDSQSEYARLSHACDGELR